MQDHVGDRVEIELIGSFRQFDPPLTDGPRSLERKIAFVPEVEFKQAASLSSIYT
jgi:hypothetical protein